MEFPKRIPTPPAAAALGSQRLPRFWTCFAGVESFSATSIHEAVAEFVDDCVMRCEPGRHVPVHVTAYGFAPMELPSAARIAEVMLDGLTDYLDEEYGNQIDGGSAEIPTALRVAALEFANAVRRHYPVWSCEEVERRVVRVRDYVDVDESGGAHATAQADGVGA